MQRLDNSRLIVSRFFDAIDFLIKQKHIRGVQTFTKKYGINRWNFYTVKEQPESGMFEVGWLENIVRDFDISAEWLLTGNGPMIKENRANFVQRKKQTKASI